MCADVSWPHLTSCFAPTFSSLRPTQTDDDAREVKVVLLGQTGVGKSSIVLRFVTNQFDKNSDATIGWVPRGEGVVDLHGVDLGVASLHKRRLLPGCRRTLVGPATLWAILFGLSAKVVVS